MATIRQIVRRCAVGAAFFVASIYATAFGTALLDELGYLDNPSAQVAALVSALGAIVTSPLFHVLSGLIIGGAGGVYLDAYLARRASRRWWEGLHTFTIKSFSCLVAGVNETDFEKSPRAKAVAAEILSYVRSGHMPLALEQPQEIPLRLQERAARPPYTPKDAGPDAIVFKRDLERLARPRDWELPWSIPPKEEPRSPDVATNRLSMERAMKALRGEIND